MSPKPSFLLIVLPDKFWRTLSTRADRGNKGGRCVRSKILSELA